MGRHPLFCLVLFPLLALADPTSPTPFFVPEGHDPTGWRTTLPAALETMLRSDSTLVERAQRFRALMHREEYDSARRLMTEGPRRWFERQEGEGAPWRIGLGVGGRWAAWDEHFRSHGEVVGWSEGEASATARVQETNDYFRLLERPAVTNELTYLFDAAGKIAGIVIRGVGERPPGRTEQFLAWARQHEPDELEQLMPGGEIDPSRDHPQRYRALLERWREAAGLPPISR